VNLCGRLSPRETAAVIERARVFLGPDSGPMHLAASVRVPSVIAFSAAAFPDLVPGRPESNRLSSNQLLRLPVGNLHCGSSPLPDFHHRG